MTPSRTALQYTKALKIAILGNRAANRSHYRYKAGAEKFAREYGYGLNDFPAKQRETALKYSYDLLAKTLFGPRPPLSKAEWDKAVRSQIL
ncbi:MAG: hypothetical protein WC489_06180 [Patescibacteria group bacterium]|jgi:hypothetical protein